MYKCKIYAQPIVHLHIRSATVCTANIYIGNLFFKQMHIILAFIFTKQHKNALLLTKCHHKYKACTMQKYAIPKDYAYVKTSAIYLQK